MNCPECTHNSVVVGHGLMGGGFGTYYACTRKSCQWFFKEQECPICEAKQAPDGSCPECGSPEEIKRKLDLLYPQGCRACGKVTKVRTSEGKCGEVCGDGLPCGGDGSPVTP